MTARTPHDSITIAAVGLAAALLIAAGTAGCHKEKDGEPAKATKTIAVDLSPIRSVIPTDLAGRLDFETRKAAKDNMVAVVPKGWEPSKVIPDRYRPTKESKLGFMTSFGVGSNCDGSCEPKDWKAVTDKVEFSRLTTGKQFKVVKDEALDGGRVVIARGSTSTYIAVAWWKQGASRYYFCRATLDSPADSATSAFEQACRNTHITSW